MKSISLLLHHRSSKSNNNNNNNNNSRWSNRALIVVLLYSISTINIHINGRNHGLVVAAAAAAAAPALDYRYFVAGGTCAAISHGITTPIDVVKTRIQAEPKKFNKGMADATMVILKEDGPQALLGGLAPTVVGYGIEGAMKFGVYEICKPIFSNLLASLSSSSSASSIDGSGSVHSPAAFLLASVVAGAVAALLLCPMESTRIRIVTDKNYKDLGLVAGLRRLIAQDGLWSTFSGLWAMLAKQVPYTFGKQVSFDVFASLLYTFFQQQQQAMNEIDMKWIVSVMSALAASIVACIFSQPGDMILTETHRPEQPMEVVAVASSLGDKKKHIERLAARFTKQHIDLAPHPPRDNHFGAVVQRIYQEGGLAGFFTGTGARILHVGMIITSQLVIYDIVKQMLGLPATGSH